MPGVSTGSLIPEAGELALLEVNIDAGGAGIEAGNYSILYSGISDNY